MLPFALALAVGGATLSAQSTLNVGPGGFATIWDAVNAAAVGDEVVVAPGTYDAFWVQKGVTVRAQVPGTVMVNGGFQSLITAPANEPVRLQGLQFRYFNLFNCNVTIEDCSFDNAGQTLSINNAVVHLERVTVQGQPFLTNSVTSVYCRMSTVTMVDCTLNGGLFSPSLGGGNGAIGLEDSELYASSCTINGGSFPGPLPALQIVSNSRARLSDCTITALNNTCGLVGNDIICSRCVLPGCNGVATGPLLGAIASGNVVRGETYSASFRGEPNQFLLVFGSNGIDVTPAPTLAQPFLLAAAGCFPAAAMMTDQNGEATLEVPIPNVAVPPGVAVYLQGVSGSAFPLLTSPVVGGVVR